MKQLSRIILTNWYLFEAEEWDIKGHVALIGKNGSGKSSFIDAIQLVMLGGSKSDWTPNAKASIKLHKRDIRGYALGIVKDEEAIGDSVEYQPRPDALTRVVLVFKDDETGESTSIGGAFSAQVSDPQAQVEGYFIAHGLDMHVSDLLDTEECVRSYGNLKALLKQQVKEGDLYLFAHEPKKFMEQMMFSLGPKGRPTVLPKVRRAFKQSINLSGLEGSVSDFVKTSILDPEPLNLEQVRKSVDSYRSKQEAVAKIKKQISALTEISSLYQRAHKAGERRAGYAWCAEELRYNGIVDQIDSLQSDLQDLWERYKKVKNFRREDRLELSRLQIQVNDLRVTLQSDDSVSQQEKLKLQRSGLEEDVSRTQKSLERMQQQLRNASDVVKLREYVPSEIAQQLDELVRLSHGDQSGWPSQPAVIDKAVQETRTNLPILQGQVDESRNKVGVESIQLREQNAVNMARLERMKQGGSDLRNNTLVLVELLKSDGIEAVPICELVEVTDQEWQPAIEAYLRANTEALIVPPEQAQKAVEIYRAAKKQNLFGATVVNTERVQHWNDDPTPGTAAALIEGSDSAAVRYIRRLLKGIRLVHETKSFMREERALTKDGMFIRQAGIQRLALPETPKLGQQARAQQINLIETQVSNQIARLSELHKQYNALKSLYDNVSTLNTKLEDVPCLESMVTRQTSDLRQIASLKKQIDAIDTSHVDSLKEQLQDVEARENDLRKVVENHARNIGGIRHDFTSKNSERGRLEKVLPELSQARKNLEADEDYNAERASSLYEPFEEDHDLSESQELEVAIRKAMERAGTADKEQRASEGNAQERLGTYLANYHTEGFSRETATKAGKRAEIDRVLQQLIDTGLHERENEAQEALHRVQRVIRSELAIRMRGHISKMKGRLSELNRELNERPFSANQKYEFTYRRLDEYSEFLRFIESVDQETVANSDSLFDEFGHLDDWVGKMLDEKMGDLLGDYRNYFHFDIAIKDEKAGITELLSRKMGSASGGENRTPFYVAMGASLASAYRLERYPDGLINGGVCMYLADEAFEKMDRGNTLQAAGYLQSIGLQLFVAAPDDAEPRLREVSDTVMFFVREGASATIEIDYVKPKARKLLAELSGVKSEKEVVAI